MQEKLKLSPPWVTYVNKIYAMFKEDKEIKIVFDNDARQVKLYVGNSEKATALAILLPYEVTIGNSMLCITIIPNNRAFNNEKDFRSAQEIFETAFKDNPVLSFCYTVEGLFSNSITYVVFKNEVVQFFNDNLNDIYGNISTLYQEIAKELFADAPRRYAAGTCYCTDVVNNVGKPLGEWP